MPNNSFSNSHTQSDFATRSAKFDIGRVTQVKTHERGDKIAHYAKIRLNQMDVDREAPIIVQCHGDVNPPAVDDYVVVQFKKGERPYIVGQWYPVEDSMDGILKNYEAGERILGHPETDASILFDTDGNILTINANEMNGGEGGGRLPNGDIRDHSGTYTYHGDEDIFVHANQDEGGSVYGVADIHAGVVQAPNAVNTTQYVNLGFLPRQIEFEATLHQMQWNEPYYTAEDSGGDKNESMAECSGVATLTPLNIHSSVDQASPPDATSTTNERQEREPYTATQKTNVTQHVQSQAWFANAGTDFRSYVGDAQVVRLIQGADAAMTEQGRVEARVTYVDDTGFELEWFMNNESGATWLSSSDVNPVVQYKAWT